MRVTIARLRRSIVVLACLLLILLAAFIVYARYRVHRLARDLPAKLGMDIQQTANGFTYSQSSRGHTYFTIHASKLIQYKSGGHATLHDVHITLYGPEGSNRADTIYGADFDYDQQTGIATARGEVQIDLSGLPSDQGPGASPTATGESEPNAVHVKTSGLTFNSKSGDAVTTELMEFKTPQASGGSTGASYNSKTGLLILNSQVHITANSNGNQVQVGAAHAELLRDVRQATLLHPTFDYQTEKSSANQAIIYFRKDGSAERVNARGNIRVISPNGAILTGETSEVLLDAKSQPVQANMGGGLNFVLNEETHSLHGSAIEGTATFGPLSALKHVQFRDAVSFVDQLLKLKNDPKGTASREMQASKLDIDFAPGTDPKQSVAEKALAAGAARINLHTVPSKEPQQQTTISGDQLLATFIDGKKLKQLDGSGNTKIVDIGRDGSLNTSKGDRLLITFTPQPSQTAAAKQKEQPQSENMAVETAIQHGNVILTQTPANKPGATANPATFTAWANHSDYHASTQILHLTGEPRINDG
ncbi:MAG: LPS export ABC transporter periplasmic protein LptC, partial [Silvibacterium sp.]|nr:LPS export ABC transporter periplasmic protein LptC [Silvibacterium sp.]